MMIVLEHHRRAHTQIIILQCLMGKSSIKISPSVASYSRMRRLRVLLFPQPFSPTITQMLPASIVNERSLMTGAFPWGYSNDTSL